MCLLLSSGCHHHTQRLRGHCRPRQRRTLRNCCFTVPSFWPSTSFSFNHSFDFGHTVVYLDSQLAISDIGLAVVLAGNIVCYRDIDGIAKDGFVLGATIRVMSVLSCSLISVSSYVKWTFQMSWPEASLPGVTSTILIWTPLTLKVVVSSPS